MLICIASMQTWVYSCVQLVWVRELSIIVHGTSEQPLCVADGSSDCVCVCVLLSSRATRETARASLKRS